VALLLPHSVFIHVPKTAGQWVAEALENAGVETEPLGPVHASPDEVLEDRRCGSRPVVFTFVRDPLTWYQSMWAHRMDEEWEPIDDPEWFSQAWIDVWEDFTRSTRSDRFEDFVENALERYPRGFVSSLYARYTSGCTHIGRQETIVDDVVRILELAGEEFDGERLARTKPKNVRGSTKWRQKAAAYTPELADRIRRVEAGAFGYL
jgi:hypothetical protein